MFPMVGYCEGVRPNIAGFTSQCNKGPFRNVLLFPCLTCKRLDFLDWLRHLMRFHRHCVRHVHKNLKINSEAMIGNNLFGKNHFLTQLNSAI